MIWRHTQGQVPTLASRRLQRQEFKPGNGSKGGLTPEDLAVHPLARKGAEDQKGLRSFNGDAVADAGELQRHPYSQA